MKRAHIIIGITALFVTIVIAGISGLFQHTSDLFIDLGPEWGLAVINGVATTVLVFVTTVHMLEVKKLRSELVRPHLSLEPKYFVYDSKTGAITGFNCLNLVNSGVVARDMEIDISLKEKTDYLYVASIGTNDRVQIWSGQPTELGNVINVTIRCSDSYNRRYLEILRIDISSLNAAKRKFVPVHASGGETPQHLDAVGKALRRG